MSMLKKQVYRAQVRSKGRLTLPSEVRTLLNLEEGDDLIFTVDEAGRVLVQRLPMMDPEQAWFWTERWQVMEREVQSGLDEGRVTRFKSVEDAVAALEKL